MNDLTSVAQDLLHYFDTPAGQTIIRQNITPRYHPPRSNLVLTC